MKRCQDLFNLIFFKINNFIRITIHSIFDELPMKLKKRLFSFATLISFVWIFAQKDSISISAKLSDDKKKIFVKQQIIYTNPNDNPISELKLVNWIAAYKKKGSDLEKRMLENRNSGLHFAKKNQFGKLLNLKVETSSLQNPDLSQENVFIPLEKPVWKNESTKVLLEYEIQLPDKAFTGYGTGLGNINLKYFFLVPDDFFPDPAIKRNFIDTEEGISFHKYWNIKMEIPKEYYVESNLQKNNDNQFSGNLNTDLELVLAPYQFPVFDIDVDESSTKVVLGFPITEKEQQDLEFYLPLQLKFIKNQLGLTEEKLLISEKFKNKEEFFGNNDIKFWKFNLQLFTDPEKTDLDYFGIVTKKILDNQLITDKEKDHWIKNGLKSYLEMQYLKNFYSETKLLGNLPDNFKLLGIKPLKFFHASKLKLMDRYGLAYQYILRQNLDQKITESFSKLSNFNDMAISNFEMGTLLNYTADKKTSTSFNAFLKNYLEINKAHKIEGNEFLEALKKFSPENDYLSQFLNHKTRYNFKLKNIKKVNNEWQVKVNRNFDDAVPFKIKSYTQNGEEKSYWQETIKNERTTLFEIPDDSITKITLNSGYLFPEKTVTDNFIYTKGLFANAKKIRFKLLKDIPNPEYSEIYINPRVNFSNAYDKFLLGLNFKNSSLFDQKFLYSVTPYFSTGTGKLTGSAGVSYTILPPESLFRSISFGVSGSYFHYDYDLAYKKFGLSTNWNFRKNPRSTVNRGFGLSYSYFDKDPNPQSLYINDYNKYNLWSFGYGYSDNQKIYEKSLSVSTQWMEDFNKITAEAFYRWEFAPNKKLSTRIFSGYFLRNSTRNDLFDFGISRVSNYTFSYNLLGQSATSGILAQQYILADGGFKSFIPGTANQWITSLNVDSSVWKMFGIYADAGVFKNKGMETQFIWDSGIRVKVIPDFLEVFFPMQSTLGFEPSFKDYGSRIRYTLVLNLNAIINAARRGWF